ncbi:FAD/NAD(P)-binding domain-containing protein [Serendipita vermifera]|nr:FAD/NAD(P)-binding domain-containing protein [Serendipita vermifera]
MMKHVAIIGAGAAGMSAAEALSALYKVTVIERTNTCGGMATSEKIDSTKFGASYINDGVQGCSPQFANTFAVFDTILGFKPADINLQVSFGRDINEDFWSNVFTSNVIDKYTADIQKFGKVLKIIKSMEPVFGLIPVDVMLSMFRFSPGFGDVIVYPLVALFMGTGQQTPYVSSVILERLFLDPSMKLFEFSPESFLASIPPMKAFPRLSEVYTTWKERLQAKGVEFLLETQAISVIRKKDGVTLSVQDVKNSNTLHENESMGEIRQLQFDEMILACDADTALKILGTGATSMEQRVLGNVKYLYDVSVTHCDRDYMEKYYQLDFKEDLFSSKRKEDPKELERMDYAKKNFKPLYFIRSYPADKRKIEMSFDLTNYQPQFDDQDQEQEGPNAKPHVYQTIFLDKNDSSQLWTEPEINPESVLLKKWWKQQSHRWQHYGGTVPWMMWINGKNHTYYCGAWTVLNMHEIAIASGFAAAYQLGAEYPFKDNDEARRLFALVLGANYGRRMKPQDRKGFFY